MLIAEVKRPITLYRMCEGLALYLMIGNSEPDFPADYKAPEQQHVWEFPEGDRSSTPDTVQPLFNLSMLGTPLPEGLHLSHARNFQTADPDIPGAYTLGISSPMELNGGR